MSVDGGVGPTGRRTALAVLSVALAAGCGGDEVVRAEVRRPAPAVERVLADPGWEMLFRRGGTPGDTSVFSVIRFAGDREGVSVMDTHGGGLVRFRRDGTRAWSFGGKGRGPGEFQRVRDVELDGRGRTWILDPDNARLTVVGRDGALDRMIPLTDVEGRPDQVVPLAGGGALVLVSSREAPVARVDSAGRVVGRLSFPWDGASDVHPMAGQVVAARHPASGAWAAAYTTGDGFFLGDGPTWRPVHGWYAEPVPFPDVLVRTSGSPLRRSRSTRLVDPTFAAKSVTLSPTRLYVLFAGSTELAGRLVDVYDLEDGGYLRSLVLPRPVQGIALGGDVLYVAFETPYPALAAVRPREGGLP